MDRSLKLKKGGHEMTMLTRFVLAFAIAFASVPAGAMLSPAQTTASAGSYCNKLQTCRNEVRNEVRRQNASASSGPRWNINDPGACRIASREQEQNEARCRAYDRQKNGKTQAQCAKCYRQAVLDAARWELCHELGKAPPVPRAIYDSIARLGAQASR